MNAEKIKALPEPAFRLMWRRGAYYVDKPEIGDTDVYTAKQVRTLLDEVEALRAAIDKATLHIAAIGYPVGTNGRYQKGGEWTFSDACPREADAVEVKKAFLAICAARHEPKDAE